MIAARVAATLIVFPLVVWGALMLGSVGGLMILIAAFAPFVLAGAVASIWGYPMQAALTVFPFSWLTVVTLLFGLFLLLEVSNRRASLDTSGGQLSIVEGCAPVCVYLYLPMSPAGPEEYRETAYRTCATQSIVPLARVLETRPTAEAVARVYARKSPEPAGAAVYESCLQGFRDTSGQGGAGRRGGLSWDRGLLLFPDEGAEPEKWRELSDVNCAANGVESLARGLDSLFAYNETGTHTGPKTKATAEAVARGYARYFVTRGYARNVGEPPLFEGCLQGFRSRR